MTSTHTVTIWAMELLTIQRDVSGNVFKKHSLIAEPVNDTGII